MRLGKNPILGQGRDLLRIIDHVWTPALRRQLDEAREKSRASTSARLKRLAAEGRPLVNSTRRMRRKLGLESPVQDTKEKKDT